MQFDAKLIDWWVALPGFLQRRYLIAAVAFMGLFVAVVVYMTRTDMEQSVQVMQQLHKAVARSRGILEDFVRVTQEEQRMQKLLEENRGFMIKSFFEQFCQKEGLTPEAGWDTRQEAMNDQIDRVVLSATFKNLTMEKIVSLVQALEKNPIVFVKDLVVTNQNDRKVTCNLAIATQRFKVTT